MTAPVSFDARFTRALPADPSRENATRQVRGAAFSFVSPTPVAEPVMLAWVPEVAALLGLPAEPTPEWTLALAGNRLLPGMVPYAAAYGGHQFGNWAGQLGDGRAITLGELVAPDGARWDVQLKGPGPTPYSRRADGRAVLRSSLRELVCSEAMFHLGVPTTRALALVGTGEPVVRDLLYDGNPRAEPGAITTRVAPSFLRFGSLELPASRGDVRLLEQLVDYALATQFPALGPRSPQAVVALFEEVVRRTAALVLQWQAVGFVHGVMNTDNMSLLGVTLDYGPYGWLEGFDPAWTPNTTDLPGRRYAYGNQPSVAQWNLMCLANALVPLVGETKPLEAALDAFADVAADAQLSTMRAKLGLSPLEARAHDDRALLRDLYRVLSSTETDWTLFFRALADVTPALEGAPDAALVQPLERAFYAPAEVVGEVRAGFAAWLRAYLARVGAEGLEPTQRRARMNGVNPLYVPRNALAHTVIQAVEQGDTALLATWLEVLRRPYEEQPGREAWAARRPEWARHQPGCSMLSCSS
ncbi:MAG: YdiU family protein [Myxococcaceae bacterium]|nr:YdiU family protein [Myxococcaceae bacterium]MCA3016871.1 YdiU family protein [Myxococcaceae bacterium]